MDTNQNNSSESVDEVRSNIAKKQVRDEHGRFFSKEDPTKVPPIQITTNQDPRVNTTNPPDMFNFKITNPLIYIKYWWKRIMANEGVELKFKAKPITVFGIALIAFSLAFGLGGVVFPFAFPWIKVNSNVVTNGSPTPAPQEWKETAIKGTLKKTNSYPPKFYLLGSSDEAVTLQVPANLNLTTLVGRRILATGSYNAKQKLLIVSDVQDLEVLPTTPVPIPTATATPTQTPVPTPNPTETPTFAPTSTPGTPEPVEKMEESEVDKELKRQEEIRRQHWQDIQNKLPTLRETISTSMDRAKLGTISPSDRIKLAEVLEEQKGLIIEAQGLLELEADEFVKRQIKSEHLREQLAQAHIAKDAKGVSEGRKALTDLIFDYSEEIDRLAQKYPGLETPEDRAKVLEKIRGHIKKAEEFPVNSEPYVVGWYVEPMKALDQRAIPFRRKLIEEKLEEKKEEEKKNKNALGQMLRSEGYGL